MKTLWLFYTSFVASSSAGRCLSPASGSGLRPSSAFSLTATFSWTRDRRQSPVIHLSDLSEEQVDCFVLLLSCICACVPAWLDPSDVPASGSLRRQTLCNNLAFRNLKQGCKQVFVLLSVNWNLVFRFHIRWFFFCIFSTDLSSISPTSCVVSVQVRETCPSLDSH